MINAVLNTINESLDGFTKLYCLLERKEGDTVEYSGGGSFNSIPFDEIGVGGYWRLRSNVSVSESDGTVACTKRQTLTYPLYFVAWFRRDEIEDTVDEFARNAVAVISSLRSNNYGSTGSNVKTRIVGWETDKQQEESGNSADSWQLLRLQVDIIFAKNCPTSCVTIVDECILNGTINDEAIGQFFSDFNIIVEDDNGLAVGSWDGTKWVVPAAGGGSFDLSIPQSPLTVTIDANKTLYIRAEDGDNLPDVQISAAEVTDDIFVTLANFVIQVVADSIFDTGEIQRNAEPRFILQDSAGNAMTTPTLFSQTGGDNQNVTLRFNAVDVQTNGVSALAFLLSLSSLNIVFIDQQGATVNPTATDTGTPGEIEYTLPFLPLPVTIGADDTTPTVGDEITVTLTATGTDSYCIWFGNGDSAAGASSSADYTYYLPGVYTLQGGAWIAATGVGGGVKAADTVDVTVAGLLDTYATSAFIGMAPYLLQRAYVGNGVEIRKTGPSATDDFGYTDAVLDEFETYVGANDGFIETLYNQVGNNAVQTTDALQPKVVNSGTLLTNPFGGWWMEFNDSEYMTIAREDFWGATRTDLFLAFAFSCDGGAASATNHTLSQWDGTGNQRSWRVGYDHSAEELFTAYTPDGTGGSQQIITFSGIALNEFGICLVKIDTSESVNDRIKAWKADASGITALTRTGTTGNASGNIHNSTADVLVGAVNPSSPSSFLSGYLSPTMIVSPDNVPLADIEKIGAVMYQRISNGN